MKLKVGDKVNIKNPHYAGHWGFVLTIEQRNDGHAVYHISGGSVGKIAPIFGRDELHVPRPKVKRSNSCRQSF